jgi:hypothetical protein
MPKAVSLVDTLRWTDADGAVQEFEDKGGTVELPQSEFARLKDAGAVASPGSKDAKAAASEETPEES